jgi:muramoyltetrapeptide carboxypeptidase
MPRSSPVLIPKLPGLVKKGDTVLVIGTARHKPISQISSGIRVLETWGLIVVPGQHVFKQHHQFSATDQERAADLQWAINHPKAKAVFLIGGGYGTLRIINLINARVLLKFPKWFIGFSDITVLHAWLFNNGIASIHGPMVFQYNARLENTQHLKTLIFGKRQTIKIRSHKLNVYGSTKGFLYGGNLSILYALTGSAEQIPDALPIVLFIEDIDEYLYHIDRMMLQLLRSKQFNSVCGVIVGDFTDIKDNAVPFGSSAYTIIQNAFSALHIPLCFGFPSGHGKINKSLLLGARVALNVNAKYTELQYLN